MNCESIILIKYNMPDEILSQIFQEQSHFQYPNYFYKNYTIPIFDIMKNFSFENFFPKLSI